MTSPPLIPHDAAHGLGCRCDPALNAAARAEREVFTADPAADPLLAELRRQAAEDVAAGRVPPATGRLVEVPATPELEAALELLLRARCRCGRMVLEPGAGCEWHRARADRAVEARRVHGSVEL